MLSQHDSLSLSLKGTEHCFQDRMFHAIGVCSSFLTKQQKRGFMSFKFSYIKMRFLCIITHFDVALVTYTQLSKLLPKPVQEQQLPNNRIDGRL